MMSLLAPSDDGSCIDVEEFKPLCELSLLGLNPVPTRSASKSFVDLSGLKAEIGSFPWRKPRALSEGVESAPILLTIFVFFARLLQSLIVDGL
jgi:hypothetical protein